MRQSAPLPRSVLLAGPDLVLVLESTPVCAARLTVIDDVFIDWNKPDKTKESDQRIKVSNVDGKDGDQRGFVKFDFSVLPSGHQGCQHRENNPPERLSTHRFLPETKETPPHSSSSRAVLMTSQLPRSLQTPRLQTDEGLSSEDSHCLQASPSLTI